MLSMVFLVPAGFLALVWRSYRKERRAREEGGGYRPEGRTRWTAE